MKHNQNNQSKFHYGSSPIADLFSDEALISNAHAQAHNEVSNSYSVVTEICLHHISQDLELSLGVGKTAALLTNNYVHLIETTFKDNLTLEDVWNSLPETKRSLYLTSEGLFNRSAFIDKYIRTMYIKAIYMVILFLSLQEADSPSWKQPQAVIECIIGMIESIIPLPSDMTMKTPECNLWRLAFISTVITTALPITGVMPKAHSKFPYEHGVLFIEQGLSRARAMKRATSQGMDPSEIDGVPVYYIRLVKKAIIPNNLKNVLNARRSILPSLIPVNTVSNMHQSTGLIAKQPVASSSIRKYGLVEQGFAPNYLYFKLMNYTALELVPELFEKMDVTHDDGTITQEYAFFTPKEFELPEGVVAGTLGEARARRVHDYANMLHISHIDYLLQHRNPFFIPTYPDSRGRVYAATSSINWQADDAGAAGIRFAHCPVSPSAASGTSFLHDVDKLLDELNTPQVFTQCTDLADFEGQPLITDAGKRLVKPCLTGIPDDFHQTVKAIYKNVKQDLPEILPNMYSHKVSQLTGEWAILLDENGLPLQNDETDEDIDSDEFDIL